MRYWSGDFNCCIETLDDVRDENGYILADLFIKYSCLVNLREDRQENVVTVSSRSSQRDICKIATKKNLITTLNHMSRVKVILLDDVIPAESAVLPDNPFQISLPKVTTAQGGTVHVHSELQNFVLKALTQRKIEDDEEIEKILKAKAEAYMLFEAQLTAQALALSEIASTNTNPDNIQPQGTDQKDKDTCPESRRMSNSSTNSSRSTTIDQTRKTRKTQKQKKHPPLRSASTPAPKSALVAKQRKSSISETPKKEGGFTIAPKRVMFSESEPTRIDSPHTLDQSETEDDSSRLETEPEDMFDMDEQIPVISIESQVPSVIDRPGTAAIPVPYGRQEDNGLPGSFKLRPLAKYSFPGPSSSDTSQPSSVDDEPEHARSRNVSTMASSMPKDIIMPTTSQAMAPLSSVKDLPSLLPSYGDLDTESFDELDDVPPVGLDRATMWKKAVASSLRLSGLVLPTPTQEEIDVPIRTRQGVRG